MYAETIRRPARTVAPTLKLLSLSEIKRHLNLPESIGQYDEQLQEDIDAAIESWEADTPMVCLTSTWVEKFDCWPDVIELRKRPVQSVSSIAYLDSAGATQTLSSSYYTFDAERVKPAIFWKPTVSLPSLDSTTNVVNQVVVTYIAGYTSVALVPALVKAAIRLKAGDFWEVRSGVMKDEQAAEAYERIRAKFERSSYP